MPSRIKTEPVRKRITGNITVSGGTGNVVVTWADLKADFMGVVGPTGSSTFNVVITDTETGVILTDFPARTGDDGNARSKSLGIGLKNITITITSANEDGVYTYLITGV